MAQSITIETTNIRSLKINDVRECRKKLKLLLTNKPDIAIVTECHINTNKQLELLERNFRYELAEYICVVNPNNRRGILALTKKSITLIYSTIINGNVLKLGIETNDTKIAVIAVYAPSHGQDVDFFLQLRGIQLNCEEPHQIICGDFNTTLNKVLDKSGYHTDSHWSTREVIREWIDSEEGNCLTDTFRLCNPFSAQYTWRNKQGQQQARLDYILASEWLAGNTIRSSIRHHPWSITDHSTVVTVFKLVKSVRGPGTFRCLPLLEENLDYSRLVKHTIKNTLIEVSKLSNAEKAAAILAQHRINQLTVLFNTDNCSPEQEEELAILISNQPTHQELLDTGTEIGLDSVLDFTIKQVGNMTKTYQKELITNQENKLRELSNDLTSARNSGNVDLIIKKDEELGTLLNQVCRQEAEKMAVFRLINDEKPTRAMINLEKKIGGYCNINKINKPNPDYIPPEEGGMHCDVTNPKMLLLSNPKHVREYMRHFMQSIYLKQEGLKTGINDLRAFLGSGNDQRVLDALDSRRLTQEERDSLEGEISKAELKNQLFKHMKPTSAPGIDGFTVAWVRRFWSDLEDVCHSAINQCYEKGQLTTMLKTAIMKLLRKGEKCKMEATNYRPISLLSVFYKIASGAITRRLETVMEKVIGRQQKAYSRKKNITSVLLNIINMIHSSKSSKRSSLIIAVDFRKAFDSLNHSFIDTCLEALNFGPSFRSWVKLFFNDRVTYLLMNGFMEEKIELQQGVPQGDILSPLVFNIVVEILLLKVGYTVNLEGVFFPTGESMAESSGGVFPTGESRVESYADDTTIGIKRDEKNLRALINIIDEFRSISGLSANLDKTHVIPVGPIDDPSIELCTDLNLNWTSSFCLLGFVIDNKLENLHQNAEKRLLKVQSLIVTWERRNLTTSGRVHIAKTLLLSQLVYYMQVLDLSENFLERVQEVLFNYIKGKTKRNWLSKDLITTPKAKGGLGFFKITDFYYAQKCTTLRRYAKEVTDDLWCDLLDQCLSLTPATRVNILQWGDLRLIEASTKVPPILKSCFIGLSKFVKSFPTDPSSRDNSWACQPLFENSNVKPPTTGHGPVGGHRLPLHPRSFGLPPETNLRVIDLYMGDGKKVTIEALQDRLQHQFPGLQIMENTHLRLLWLCPYICGMGKKFNGQERVFPNTAPLLDRHPPFHTHPSITSLIMKIKKGSKYYLKSLNRAGDFLTADHLEGWKRLMDDPSMTKDDLRRAYKMAQSKVFSGKQRDTILKLLTRKTLFNNQIPHIYGENLPAWFQSIHCIECQTKRNIDVVETGTHALKDCPSVSEYYAAVSQAFEVPYSSTTLAGFFHHQPGPRPNQIINNDMYSTLVWLAAIQLISYRNSQTPFDDAMICNIITDFKTIRSSYKGFLIGTVGGLFDNPRPPEIINS